MKKIYILKKISLISLLLGIVYLISKVFVFNKFWKDIFFIVGIIGFICLVISEVIIIIIKRFNKI
jgi:hypothetical protein